MQAPCFLQETVSWRSLQAETFFHREPIHHFALRTTNTDACVTAVRQAGYPITVEPKEIVIASEPPFPARIAFCQGPLGEVIEFFQER